MTNAVPQQQLPQQLSVQAAAHTNHHSDGEPDVSSGGEAQKYSLSYPLTRERSYDQDALSAGMANRDAASPSASPSTCAAAEDLAEDAATIARWRTEPRTAEEEKTGSTAATSLTRYEGQGEMMELTVAASSGGGGAVAVANLEEEVTVMLNEDTDEDDQEGEEFGEQDVPPKQRVSIAPDSPLNGKRQETEDVYDTDWTLPHSDMQGIQRRLTSGSYATAGQMQANPVTQPMSLARRTVPDMATPAKQQVYERQFNAERIRRSTSKLQDPVSSPEGRETIPTSVHRDDFHATRSYTAISQNQIDAYSTVDEQGLERESSFICYKGISDRVEWDQKRPRSMPSRIAAKVLGFCLNLRRRAEDLLGSGEPQVYEPASAYPPLERLDTSGLGPKKRRSAKSKTLGFRRQRSRSHGKNDKSSRLRSASPVPDLTEVKEKWEGAKEEVELVQLPEGQLVEEYSTAQPVEEYD